MKDIFILNLSSEGMDSGSNSADTFFNIRLPNKRTDYKKYCMYVDNFILDTDDLGNQIYCVRLNCFQPNTYNSLTNSNNDIIAMVIQSNLATARTIDLALTYPTAPIYIDNLPEQLQFKITSASSNTALDFDTGSNQWSITLRIEAEYGEDCGCN